MMKKCIKCKHEKSLKCFCKNKRRKSGLNDLCRVCDSYNQWKSDLKRFYNVSVEMYNKMLENQQFKCCICEVPQKQLSQRLTVDHNHKTGKIRGLLCQRCNLNLSYIEDTLFLEKALIYLQK